MKKIICIGNRYLSPDGASLWIYDKVMQEEKSFDGKVWIEGGIGGMNLLPHFQTQSDILLIDYIPEVKNATLFQLDDLLSQIDIKEYNHASALYYLLGSLDTVLDEKPNIEVLSCNPENECYQNEIINFVKGWKA
ncbi:MAG: Ni,Fe-hydrogenase maturation factor [Sulfurimonas sp.]|jgi:Ni,Fe-hydrogenase maturation factor|uniref:hypothetical protein n=1 Tax=Sulfurimonas sp. TaxID=2022749 RepID=UPI0039E3CBFD